MLRYSIEETIKMVMADIRKINPTYCLFILPRNSEFAEIWVRDKAKLYKTVKVKKYIK